MGGNYYTGESTLGGVGAQMALGTLGVDVLADARDLTYNFKHRDTVTPGQIALDAIGLLPLVGGLKYADEAADILKHSDDLADAAADAGKYADELAETGQQANKTLAATNNLGYSEPVIMSVPPGQVRFSQKTVNGSTELIGKMQKSGWQGDPIDVVRMPDGGITSVDNTRLRAANLTDTDVLIRVHDYNEPFPTDQLKRFKKKKRLPTTWGDAVDIRIDDQGATFRKNNPYGTFLLPRENS